MPTVLSESNNLSDVLKFEMENNHSRKIETILSGEDVAMGEVVGKVTIGSVPTTGTAGTNTGANTVTSVTGGSKTKVGVYKLTCIVAIASGGVYTVRDPDGEALPNAVVGTAYVNDAINFTINDAGTDAAVGDTYTITVPEGSGKLKPLTLDAINGTQDAYGIMLYPVDTTDTTQRSVAYTSGGTLPITPGMNLEGASSGATAQVVSVSISSGTFAAGTAAGTLVVDNQSGTFESENLDASDQDNIATIGGNTAAYYPDRKAAIIVRDAQVVEENLVWPSGISVAQQAAAMAQLYSKGIVAVEQA